MHGAVFVVNSEQRNIGTKPVTSNQPEERRPNGRANIGKKRRVGGCTTFCRTPKPSPCPLLHPPSPQNAAQPFVFVIARPYYAAVRTPTPTRFLVRFRTPNPTRFLVRLLSSFPWRKVINRQQFHCKTFWGSPTSKLPPRTSKELGWS